MLADRVGRLPVLIIANLTGMIGNLATMFSKDVATFSAARFISGMATDSNFVLMYIIAFEYLRPSTRTLGLNLCIGIFYCLGSVITPLIALKLKGWRLFLEVTAIPLLIVPSFWFVLPESIHYLVSSKKPQQALAMLHKVASVNSKRLPTQFDEDFMKEYQTFADSKDTKSNAENLWGLFKTPRLRKNMLILFFKSYVLCFACL